MIPPTYGGHQDPVRLSQARVGSVSTFRALSAAWRTSPGPPDYAYAQSVLVPQGKAYFPASPSKAEVMGRRAGVYLTPIQRETGPPTSSRPTAAREPAFQPLQPDAVYRGCDRTASTVTAHGLSRRTRGKYMVARYHQSAPQCRAANRAPISDLRHLAPPCSQKPAFCAAAAVRTSASELGTGREV